MLGEDKTIVKRITIRVHPDLHQQLTQISSEQAKSLNTLAIEALELYAAQMGKKNAPFPLQALSELLAPAAEGEGLTENELLAYARTVRRRIWQDRYEHMLRSVDQDS